MSADNLDRELDDLKRTLEDLPPPAIWWVLGRWQRRIDEIRGQLSFVGAPLDDPKSPAAREAMVLERAKREIEAACAVEKGDARRAFRIMLEGDEPK